MSNFCGKCDLYDHIYMTSDETKTELDLFNEFKRKTNGVIYQSLEINLTDNNIDAEIEKINNPILLSKIEHKKVVHTPQGKEKEKIYYTYKYFGKEYKNLKQISKIGYWTRKEIKFNKMIDLIKYYPYIISAYSSSDDGAYVLIGSESYVDTQEKSFLSYGLETKYLDYYRKQLVDEYIRVVKTYEND